MSDFTYCYGKVVCPSVCPSAILRLRRRSPFRSIRDVEISWSHRLEFFTSILWLVSLRCSLSADQTSLIYSKGNTPKLLILIDPSPVDLSVADIQWQIAAEWSDSAMATMGRLYHRCFESYDRRTPMTSPSTFHQNWVSNSPLVIWRISNGRICATGDPIHFIISCLFLG